MIFLYYIVINSFGFLSMGIDKYKAVHHKYRISEFALLLNIVLGGMIGSLLGMLLFHHKTRKRKFLFTILLSFSLHITLCIFVNYLL